MSRLDTLLYGFIKVIVDYNVTQVEKKKYSIPSLYHLPVASLEHELINIIKESLVNAATRKPLLEYYMRVAIQLKNVADSKEPITEAEHTSLLQSLSEIIEQSKKLLKTSHLKTKDINCGLEKPLPMYGFTRGSRSLFNGQTLCNAGQVLQSFIEDYQFPDDKTELLQYLSELITEHQAPLLKQASELEHWRLQIEAMDSANRKLEAKVGELQAALAAEGQSKLVLQGQLSELESQFNSLASEKTQLVSGLQTTQEKMTVLEAGQSDKVAQLEAEKAAARKALGSKDKQIEQLQMQLSDANAQIDALSRFQPRSSTMLKLRAEQAPPPASAVGGGLFSLFYGAPSRVEMPGSPSTPDQRL